MTQIELKDISKTFKGEEVKVKAVDNVSLKISKGGFVAIIGPSGSGKSTLMHVIGALTKPTNGIYKFENIDTSRMSEAKLANLRKKKIGFVFQSFNLISRISALANVELPMIYKRVSSKKRKKRALELLKKVGLEKRASFRPNRLSGGEMQRVAIARALANEPDVILADEPTGNLDTKSGKEIINIFKSLNEEGITIIIVTHEKEIAEKAKKIVKLRDGRVEGVNDAI